MLIRLLEFFNRRVLFPWRENRVISELAPLIKPGAQVLDFGCGDGHLTLNLARCSGAAITGIDIVPPEKKWIPRITYDGNDLPIKKGSFDGAVMVDMLHHTKDVKEALRRLCDAVTDFLLIKDMKYRSPLGYRVLQFTDLWTNSPDPNALLRYNYLTWDEWRRIFAELNLSIAYYKPFFSLIPFDPIRNLNFICLLHKRGESASRNMERKTLEVNKAEQAVRKANRDLFEKHTEAFRKLHEDVLDGEEAYIDETLRQLRCTVKEGPVLDAGCGDGRLTAMIRRRFPEVTGVDLSQVLLNKVPEGIRRTCGDLQHLPFSDQRFSLVLCHYTLHHLYSVDRFIAETYRVLRPGGVLFIDHEMKSGFMRRFRWIIKLHDALFGLDKRYRKADPSLHAGEVRMAEFHYFHREGFSCSDLAGRLERAGFSHIRIRHHWYGVNRFPNYFFSWLKLMSFPASVSPHFSVRAQRPEA